MEDPAIHRNCFFLLWIFVTFATDSQAFSQGSISNFFYVNFMISEFSYLNVTSIGRNLIQDENDCGYACLKIPSCFSYNVAAFPEVNGKLQCELLPSDKFNYSDKFNASREFHHIYIASLCDSSPCKNAGKCISLYQENGYKCICVEGFTGKNCETNINECENSPCLNNGTCTDRINEFNCSCPPGFSGNRCEIDLNECSSNFDNCHVNAICHNTVGSYTCSCKPGYRGDGRTCSPNGLQDSVIVGSNRNHLTSLNNWLSPVTRSVYARWRHCWRTSVHGWAASTFHSRCDGKGPTVTIIRVGSYIFGGYASVSWGSSGGWQYDSKAFLFSLVNKPGWAPVKLPQTGKYSSSKAHSLYFHSSYGPTFGGGHDIRLSNNASSNTNSYSNLDYTYDPPRGYSYGTTSAQTFLAGSYSFKPDEIETFYETT